MSALDLSIIKFFKKASLRIKVNFYLKNFIVGLIVSLCLCLFIIITSIFITFKDWMEICFIITMLGVITSIIFSFIFSPKEKQIALIVDSKGLKERVTTSLDFIGDETSLSIAQKNDTVNSIKSYDIKKNLPIRIPKKGVYIIGILLALCLVGAFVPSQARSNEKSLRSFEKYKKETIKKVQLEEKKIKDSESLSEEEKKALEEELKRAVKELKEAEKKKQLDKALEKLEKKLDNFEKEVNSEEAKKEISQMKETLVKEFNEQKLKEGKEDKNKLLTELNKNNEGKKLADAMESGDKSKIENALNNLNSQLKNMTQAEKSKLSAALNSAALNMSDEELQEALANASSDVLDGEIDPDSLADALASLQKSSSGEPKDGQSGGKQQGTQSGDGQGSGNGSGQGNDGGSGSGSGSGNGVGTGVGGGWNTGSKDGSEENPDLTNKENVDELGRDQGNDKNLSGGKNQSGNSQTIETEKGLNIGGEKVDIESVIGDYSNEAFESLDKGTLPETMKEAIMKYFDSLK